MFIYRVTYAHEDEHATDETQKHGYAMQEFMVDHEIETQEDVMEIARTIGRENDYTKVAIIKIEQRADDEPEQLEA